MDRAAEICGPCRDLGAAARVGWRTAMVRAAITVLAHERIQIDERRLGGGKASTEPTNSHRVRRLTLKLSSERINRMRRRRRRYHSSFGCFSAR